MSFSILSGEDSFVNLIDTGDAPEVIVISESITGGSGGTGTVTSVALTAPNIFSVAGSPITTAGTLAITLVTQSANTVFAGPSSGATAAPAFRALVADDIPALPYVTSVGLQMPGNDFNVFNSPVTSSGTLSVSWKNKDEGFFLGGPSGGGTPVFQSLAPSNYSTLIGNSLNDPLAGYVLSCQDPGANIFEWVDPGASIETAVIKLPLTDDRNDVESPSGITRLRLRATTGGSNGGGVALEVVSGTAVNAQLFSGGVLRLGRKGTITGNPPGTPGLLQLWNGGFSYNADVSIGVQAGPGGFTPTTPYIIWLPYDAPTVNGQALTVNTDGTASWTTLTTGTVTSVSASSPLASSGGTTPNISLSLSGSSEGDVLTIVGGVAAWAASGAGTGDFVGPASSLDLAVVRFDGTTGKLGQNSAILITDYTTSTQNNVAIKADDGATAKIALALLPKGDGALIAAIPDGGTGGGDARGIKAVDWQMQRANSNEVVSGDYSVIGGGENNKLTSTYGTIAGGYSNEITATYGAVAGGNDNAIAGNYGSIGGGVGNSISGGASYAAIPGGSQNSVLDTGGVATGVQAISRVHGQRAHAAGEFITPGDAQAGSYLLRQQTTNNTTTEAYLNGTAARLVLNNNTTIKFEGTVVARQTNATANASWRFHGQIHRNANAASTVLDYSTITKDWDDDGNWTFALSADTTNGSLKADVTGNTGDNVNWVIRIETVETTG